MEWYLKVMKENYSNFNGRARRKEYWMFVLIYAIIAIVAMFLDNALGLDFTFDTGYGEISYGYGWLYVLTALIHFVPTLAVAVRRLHDVGKSGWFYFIVLIPLVGPIWLLVLLCTEGAAEENIYGPSPKSA